MDPNAALEQARLYLSKFRFAETEPKQPVAALEAATKLADAFEALDTYMTNHGFPPDGWCRMEQ